LVSSKSLLIDCRLFVYNVRIVVTYIFHPFGIYKPCNWPRPINSQDAEDGELVGVQHPPEVCGALVGVMAFCEDLEDHLLVCNWLV